MAATVGARLFGRNNELGELDALIRSAAAGTGGSMLFVGEPGVGKSRLVEAALDAGQRAGLDVAVGEALQVEIPWPLAAVLDALDVRAADLLGPLAASRSLLEAGATAAPGFLLADRLLEAVESRCAERALLLVIENLHWADPATIAWLGEIADRAASLPLAVVATSRPPLAGSPLQRWMDHARVDRTDLLPLHHDDVHAMAAELLGGLPGQRLLTELDGAGGNPLLVHALLDSFAAAGALSTDATGVELTGRGQLRAVGPIAARVGELDAAALTAIQVAAVIGSSFALDDLAAVMGKRVTDLLAPVEAARRAGVLNDNGPRYVFVHELHRDAVLSTLPDAAIAPIHLDVARALAAGGAPALEVAEHFARGARPGNREAIAWLQRAAIEIVDQAPGTAMRLLDVALALCGSSPSPSLLLARVRALSGAGHTAAAGALGRSLLREGLGRDSEARLRRELGFAYFVEGRASEAVAEIEQYGQLTVDELTRGRAAAELAFARFVNLDHAGARRAATDAVTEGHRVGDVAAEVGGGGVLAWLDLFRCDFAAACTWADGIVALAEQPHAAEAHLYQPWLVSGLVWLETDHLDKAAQAVRRGQEMANTRGAAWAIPSYDAADAYVSLRRGELDDAAAAATAALGYLEGSDGFGVAVWCHSFLAIIALHRGDEALAEQHIATAEEWSVRGRAQFGVELCMLARGRLHAVRGQHADALRSMSEAWDLCTGIGLLAPRQLLAPELVSLAVAAGDSVLAASVAQGAVDAAAAAGTHAFHALATLAVAHRDGNAVTALEAVGAARLAPRPPLLAAALADAARLLRRAGRSAEAARCAAESAEMWSAMAVDAEAEIAAQICGGGRAPQRRPRFGYAALTATERRVVRLISEGLSNLDIAQRLSVSRRTVESHMSSAYRKLGVTSRVALARAVLDHDEATSMPVNRVQR